LKKLILKHALINAAQHGGKANVKAVVGRVLSEKPELRKHIKDLIKEVKKTVKEVNSLGSKEQQKRLKRRGIKPKKPKEEKMELPKLPDAKRGQVITAFPPEPSKYPHLGHAKAAFLNYTFAKKYKGQFILRFEDTNPEFCKKEYYDIMVNGLRWLGIEPDKIEYVSDFIEEYYKATEKLLMDAQAYICLCPKEKVRANRAAGKPCKCRKLGLAKNLTFWERMLADMPAGEATIRLRIDMQSQNTTLRDPTIMRIVEAKHPRTNDKYRVWPTYDFGTALMDAWEGVTHRVRSKEFEIRKDLQRHIQKIMGYTPPHIVEIGRLNLEGVPSSGRLIRKMIKEKELMGWDDPRLTTLVALERRGFLPDAINEFLLSTGVSKAESTITWDVIEAFNRKMLDPMADRYNIVLEPVKISVEKAPEIKEVEANIHPDFPKKGKRKIKVGTNKIYISNEDLEKYKRQEVRLIDLFNVRLRKDKIKFTSEEVKDVQKLQWVSEPSVKLKVVMPDGNVVKGRGESALKKLKLDSKIQAIRVGFLRLDSKDPLTFYFTHK